MSDKPIKNALYYHQHPKPGKIEVTPTKALSNQTDLALAYSPGVAEPCLEIAKDPSSAALYTARSNLVAVITNGTAVLGLGDIGPLASKPVMEGKGVLFKKFGGVDVFDIEINEKDPDKFVDIVASLAPTFGGINLEDIKAPECFFIEKKLREKIDIPVFHDDQHGTAIITAAAILNGLKVANKDISTVRLVASGAGAAGIACLDMLVEMGLKRENILVSDSKGIIHDGRTEGMDDRKQRYATKTDIRTLAEATVGADIFLGVSRAGMMTKDMVKQMAKSPIIFALANPTPEILPEEIKEVRDDAIIATGRSDYPNQVNNVLCFPYIFRGALDVGATTINEEMKLACIRALSKLAQKAVNDDSDSYVGKTPVFGPEYLIPRPFDPNLIIEIPLAVAKAAMESGVATKPIKDFNHYRASLERYVYRSGMVMKPIFEQAKLTPKRVVYAEGENGRVLRAVQEIVNSQLASPILVGRKKVIIEQIDRLGLETSILDQVEIIEPDNNPYFRECVAEYHKAKGRKGVSLTLAQNYVRTKTTVLASLLVKLGKADAMICGMVGNYHRHLGHITDILDKADGVKNVAALSAISLQKGVFFFCDTMVNNNPTTDELVAMTLQSANHVKRFGITPKAALLSHSNFGSANDDDAKKMSSAVSILHEKHPQLEVEGEIQADAALLENLRKGVINDSKLNGEANLFIFPNLDAANISFNMVRILSDGVTIGPILLGLEKPVHVLKPFASVRRILNMTALCSAEQGEVS
ncbi:NADP-dependent malic enzyme [Cycloclasticus pugetii]|uniref:NADP-dependent malic enzyme n=1 Tax=Cycloclasticus pugetii TaxID=34068 RepID=UPI000915D33A|nr:NADP-dependent malic enzyme [Cycloclasticus pugetii]SHI92454.1 malate dehydrogenase (oxaloacetate-decarboxylating)(NADP+) [Cycloclasticus pugetii]|tara:strand:+ start:2142 stop:4409 length:2268 start_codon:yes stop_codon:yes gene_type:complete